MREEPGVQSPAQTLSAGAGSCRDFATLFIEICRHYGLASRFISGYVLNETVADEHTATHAWSEIYLPGSGWRDSIPPVAWCQRRPYRRGSASPPAGHPSGCRFLCGHGECPTGAHSGCSRHPHSIGKEHVPFVSGIAVHRVYTRRT